MNTSKMNPFSAAKFSVEIEQLGAEAKFQATSVTGLSMQLECLPSYEGPTKRLLTRKGRLFCQDITITRQFTGGKSLFSWFKACRDGEVQKSNGSIIVQNDDGGVACRFDLAEAWPISWSGPDFFAGAGSETCAEETVVLSVQSLELA